MVFTLNSVSFATRYLENETQTFFRWCWRAMPYRIHLQIWLLNPVWMACRFDYYTLCDLFLWLYLCLQSSGKKYDINFQNEKIAVFISFYVCVVLKNEITLLHLSCKTRIPFKRNDHFQIFDEVFGSASHLCFQIPNFFAALCAIAHLHMSSFSIIWNCVYTYSVTSSI